MRVSVALCTYNGEKYIKDQLFSISSQTTLPAELVVCDDGSMDATVSIIREFSNRSPFPVYIHINPSQLGVRKNFCKSVGLCESDYIAFADQDDVWLPHKLAHTVKLLQQTPNPSSTLYCSRLQYVNAKLNTIGLSPIPSSIGFQNAIVENIATGCSVAFGYEIKRRLLQAEPSDMMMHDWWAYLIAAAFGHIVFDSTPTVLYRQHGGNVAGWERKPKKIYNRIRGMIRRLRAENSSMDSLNQAALFVSTYPDISKENRMLVEELLNLRKAGFIKRLPYALQPQVRRNDFIENFGLKIMLLMGWH